MQYKDFVKCTVVDFKSNLTHWQLPSGQRWLNIADMVVRDRLKMSFQSTFNCVQCPVCVCNNMDQSNKKCM